MAKGLEFQSPLANWVIGSFCRASSVFGGVGVGPRAVCNTLRRCRGGRCSPLTRNLLPVNALGRQIASGTIVYEDCEGVERSSLELED